MIVGIGNHPKFILDVLQEVIAHPDILIYPEFFDCKKLLIQRKYKSYYFKLLKFRDEIEVAVWPDYLYHDKYNLKRFNFKFIFPLHSLSEIDFILKLSDKVDLMLGFPNKPELRDYNLRSFIEIAEKYGLEKWLLGLKTRLMKYLHLFDGTDVTTLSFPGVKFANLKNTKLLQKYVMFIENLSNIKHQQKKLTDILSLLEKECEK